MVKRKLAAAWAMAGAAMVLVLAIGGCAANGPQQEKPTYGPGEPPLMPASHAGRYESLGAPGCYGCHGANEATDHMLAAAPALPADHYVDGDTATCEVFGPRGECITCHPLG